MANRAPRLNNIEIPLDLTSEVTGEVYQCACFNISSSGALIRFVSEVVAVVEGDLFHTRMFKNGHFMETWMIVERVDLPECGMKFLDKNEWVNRP